MRRLPTLLWLLPALVILLAGCATRCPMISTWQNSQVVPTRADTFALTRQPHASPENAELDRLLTAELKREGFHLVPAAHADYLIAGALEDELVSQGRSVALTTPGSPPQTTAQMAGVYATEPTFPPTTALQPVLFRKRGIRLFLYRNPRIHPGSLQIVWQGYITAGQAASAEDETARIKTLLGYLGREYHGSAKPAQKEKPQD